jgi:hypothetical protein
MFQKAEETVKNAVFSEEHISTIRVERIRDLGTLAVFLCSILRLLVAANVHNSPIIATLMMEALRSSET